jgi:hypothetical protein
MTEEEKKAVGDFQRALFTFERPMCWWCRNRPTDPVKDEVCERGVDWKETIGMERKSCEKFNFDWNRLRTRKETKPRQAEQLKLELPPIMY